MKPPRQSKSTEYKHLREQAALPGRGGIARIWAAFWNTVGGLREGLGSRSHWSPFRSPFSSRQIYGFGWR
jgi:hypothetical protein